MVSAQQNSFTNMVLNGNLKHHGEKKIIQVRNNMISFPVFFWIYLIKRYHRVLVSFRLGLMKRCVVTLQNSSQWKKYRYHWSTDQHLTTSKWLTKNPTLNVTNSKTKDTTERTVKSRKLLLLVCCFRLYVGRHWNGFLSFVGQDGWQGWTWID